MIGISENDWELVNAYHDGELSDDARVAFERRLRAEPALAEALRAVEGASRSLKALKPQQAVTSENVQPERRLYWIGGLAAALAVIAFGVWASYDRVPTLLDMHTALQEQAFEVALEDIRDVALARQLGVHDLTGANLASVSATPVPHGTMAHYAGVNGCRLSYFKLDRAFKLPPGPEAQTIAWTTADGAHHAIVATGMDIEKFDAIATYLQHITHDLAKTDVYASMARATQNAVPCVG